MLDVPAINRKVYAMVMAYGDELLAKLPAVSFEQRTALEAARSRYDVLIGIVDDNEAVGVSDAVKQADLQRFKEYIHSHDGHPVVHDEEQLAMLQELTGLPQTLCEVFILEEFIEECAGGLVGDDVREDMTDDEIERATAELYKEIDGYMEEIISS
jgi:hypothetical protein